MPVSGGIIGANNVAGDADRHEAMLPLSLMSHTASVAKMANQIMTDDDQLTRRQRGCSIRIPATLFGVVVSRASTLKRLSGFCCRHLQRRDCLRGTISIGCIRLWRVMVDVMVYYACHSDESQHHIC